MTRERVFPQGKIGPKGGPGGAGPKGDPVSASHDKMMSHY